MLRASRGVILIVSALGLSACGGLQWPPPPQLTPNTSSGAAQTPVARPQVTPARNVTVQDGETLYDVAKRSGATPRAIIDANKLQPPYRLAKGQSLILPAATTHVVARGETLTGISRQYGADTFEIARLNNLQPPYNIRVGQQLVLPGGDLRGVEVAERTSALPAVVPSPRGGVDRVQVEELKPAPGPSASTNTVAQLPPAAPAAKEMAAPAVKEIAAPAYVPPPSAPEPATVASNESALPDVAAALASLPAAASAPAAAPTASPAQESTQLASLPRSNAKPRAGGKFIWPVEGKLMSEYGAKGDGLHNDGINIAAAKGAPVYAAANGTVAYAGNEIRGFGNLLLIQHADGWMTAYAHNDKLLVKRGDKVTQGQQIGAVGATGNVTSPQLHFEIRRGKRAVDPLDQLASVKS